jgi:ABC-2 type transport system ATP-binding protein
MYENRPVLSVTNLTVRRGGETIVRGVSFHLCRGEIVGLIGPNGAGKSTTIGGILGLYPWQEGSLTIGDSTLRAGDEWPPGMRRQIAYIPEQPMWYEDLTLAEHLEWKRRLWEFAHAQENHRVEADTVDVKMTWRERGESIAARLGRLIERFQLEPHMDKFPHQCSKGTLQKLMVVSAFLFPFRVLLVDEPFIGLDVTAIRRLKEEIAAAKEAGAAVLLSTHVLDSAERLCDRFLFVEDGRVLTQGTLADLRQRYDMPDATLEDLFVAVLETKGALAD